MRRDRVVMFCGLLLCSSLFLQAQQNVATNTNVAVPPLINFSGTLTDVNGKPMSGVVGVTFSLYSEQTGDAALWMETQNVQPDNHGNYTVMLGSTSSAGLPAEIFVAGQARWLGVRAEGEAEQPRVLLVSAPYALKAGDAETIGGLPPSAFVLAAPPSSGANANAPVAAPASAAGSPLTTSDVTTNGGTVGTIAAFTTATNIQSSLLSQTGTTAINVAGKLNLPSTGTATATKGFSSHPQSFVASAYNSSSAAAVAQAFQLQAESFGNDTASPSGTLNLLYGSGTSTPAETGLKISSKGLITFATGQTFPGSGTVTGVTAGTDLTGGGTSGNVTLNLNTTALNSVYPQLAANNTFTGTQFISNITTITGSDSSGVLQVANTGTSGGNPAIFAYTLSTGASAIKGTASASSGITNGLYGISESDSGNGVQGTGPYVGVYGNSAFLGVYGAANGESGIGITYGHDSGVWGDTGGTKDTFSGVLGTADDNVAGLFYNDSGTDASIDGATIYASNGSTTAGVQVLDAFGLTGDACTIDNRGNLSCTGKVGGAVQAAGGARQVSVYAMQSPENWFEDFGSGTLANGAATIVLDPTFAQTVNTSVDYHVFLTPKGDSEGLYVSNETPQGFEVHEQRGGHSYVAFDYRIVAKRSGYENLRLVDVTEQYQSLKQNQQLRRQRIAQRREVRPR
jgi:hypothetical protein